MKNSATNVELHQASVNEVATQWEGVTRRARRSPVQITYKGKPSAFVLMKRADYQRMAKFIAAEIERREDEEDIAMYEARRHEMDGPCITLAELEAELKRNGKL